ncbi:MAG: DUF1385 domain-containing protein [Polyangiales bacterium]
MAVIEGVMMRSPQGFTVAVRRKDSIVVRSQPWRSIFPPWVLKTPFLRGAAVLVETMQNGLVALRFSAEQFEQDLPEEERSQGDANSAGQRLAIVMQVALFIALPKLLAWAVGWIFGHGLTMADPRFHILAGLFKLAIVLGLLWTMRLNPITFRNLQYHGAEHKAIAVHEAGLPLTVENARKFSTRHARCGTTFLMVVVAVSILVFALVLPALLPHSSGFGTMLASILISIPLMIPIAGLSYELQRVGARFVENPLAQFFLAPGYLVQRISTAEPTDDQVEIAFVALRTALAHDAEAVERPEVEPIVKSFPSFAAFATETGH